MHDVYLPILRLLPVESGQDLKIFALNGRIGQIVPPSCCDRDAWLSVQQGQLRLERDSGSVVLQAHEGALLAAGVPFQLESLTDTRARLVMPVASVLSCELAELVD